MSDCWFPGSIVMRTDNVCCGVDWSQSTAHMGRHKNTDRDFLYPLILLRSSSKNTDNLPPALSLPCTIAVLHFTAQAFHLNRSPSFSLPVAALFARCNICNFALCSNSPDVICTPSVVALFYDFLARLII